MTTLQRVLEYAIMVLSFLFAMMTLVGEIYYDWKVYQLVFPQFASGRTTSRTLGP